MRDLEWCETLGFLSKRSFLKNERSPKQSQCNLSTISNPPRVNRGVFIGKSPKNFGF